MAAYRSLDPHSEEFIQLEDATAPPSPASTRSSRATSTPRPEGRNCFDEAATPSPPLSIATTTNIQIPAPV